MNALPFLNQCPNQRARLLHKLDESVRSLREVEQIIVETETVQSPRWRRSAVRHNDNANIVLGKGGHGQDEGFHGQLPTA